MTGPRKPRKAPASEQGAPPKLVVRARQKPPVSSTKAEAAEWRTLVNSLPADFFKPCDRPLLRAWSVIAAQFAEFSAIVAAEGLMIASEKKAGSKRPNPAMYGQHQCVQTLMSLATKLRVSPASRMDDRVAATKTNADKNAQRPWEEAA